MYRLLYMFRQCLLLIKESKKSIIISILFLSVGFATVGSSYTIGKRLFGSSLSLKNKINIVVFFKNDTDAEDVNKTVEEIKAIDGVKNIELIDKNKAEENFLKSFPQYSSLLHSLDENPFPYTAKVYVQNLELGNNIASIISSFPTTDSVIFSKDVAEKIINLSHILWLLLIFIFIVVTAEFIFISQSLISLLIDLRRSDIKILTLIGADRLFIQFPYLLVIFITTLISWIISFIVLKKIDLWSITAVQKLIPFANYSTTINVVSFSSLLFIFGILINWAGAIIPLRKIR